MLKLIQSMTGGINWLALSVVAYVYFLRASWELRKGNHKRALSFADFAVERLPNVPETFLLRARINRRNFMPSKALSDYDKSIKLDPTCALSHFERGLAYRDLDQLDASIKDLSIAIDLHPKRPNWLLERGNVWMQLHKFENAKMDFSEAIRLSPCSVTAHLWRAKCWMELGRPEESLVDASKAVEISHGSGNAYLSQGVALLHLGRVKPAIDAFSEALDKGTEFPQSVLEQRASAFLQQMQYRSALDDAAAALRLGDSPSAWHAFALASRHLGDEAQALAALNKARSLDQTSSYILMDLAWLLATSGDPEVGNGAMAVTLSSQLMEQGDLPLWLRASTSAAASAQAGDFANAVRLQKLAIKDAPSDRTVEYEKMLHQFESQLPYHEKWPSAASVLSD